MRIELKRREDGYIDVVLITKAGKSHFAICGVDQIYHPVQSADEVVVFDADGSVIFHAFPSLAMDHSYFNVLKNLFNAN